MATTRIYLDRHLSKDGTADLKLEFAKDRRNVSFSLGIRIGRDQWDPVRRKIVNHPNKTALNNHVSRRKTEADLQLLLLSEKPDWRQLSAYEVRDILAGKEKRRQDDRNLFAPLFERFVSMKRKENTRRSYLQTAKHVRSFVPDYSKLSIREIDVQWLTLFDRFMDGEGLSVNTRAIHMRNLRAVVNFAIDEGIITSYPFRKFRIRREATAKRSLTVEQLRTLFNYTVEPYARKYLDYFKLTFFLMGINTIDLFALKEITSEGRIEYHRSKTGKLYSIKVEPEAMEIINRHRGRKALLDMADTYSNYRDYAHHMNDALKKIGPVKRSGLGGKKTVTPLFPKISIYWARHSWATTAAYLDIPKETIAAGLGHGGNTVTDIYIDFDRKKVDAANRKVIDFVLYGKE